MAKIEKKLVRYSEAVGGRIYRPVKPLVNPLVKRIKLVYVLGILAGLGLAGSLWYGWKVKGNEQVSWWPWSARAHAAMALEWFENGEEVKAEAELKKANKLVLWETDELRREIKKTEDKVQEVEKIRREIESWEKVLEEKPYYRDGLLRLALLNYQIYEDEKAEEYFKKAEYLDPNNEEVKRIGEIISL